MLHAVVAAVCLSAGFAGPAPAEPVGFELSSATIDHGVTLRYTTTCPPGTAFYGLGVSIAQRTGAHVAIASATLREHCGRRTRSIVLRAGDVPFRPGVAHAQVWGCAGAGCFQLDPFVVRL